MCHPRDRPLTARRISRYLLAAPPMRVHPGQRGAAPMRRLLAAVSLMALALVPLGPADGALIVSSSIDGGPIGLRHRQLVPQHLWRPRRRAVSASGYRPGARLARAEPVPHGGRRRERPGLAPDRRHCDRPRHREPPGQHGHPGHQHGRGLALVRGRHRRHRLPGTRRARDDDRRGPVVAPGRRASATARSTCSGTTTR